MELWQNIPVALIVLPLVFAPLCSVSKPKIARFLALFASVFSVLLSVMLICKVGNGNASFVYKMGEYGAPFGNELFISGSEAAISLLFSSVMMLSLFAGLRRIGQEIDENRKSLFYTVCVLLLTAIQALTFTNDIFTGFVFLEITTIAAGALIFVRSKEGSLFAAMRYMIMNLLGSGLFLLGISVFYCLTGELLFPQMKEHASLLVEGGRYIRPLSVSLLLITLGLAVKSALYPFHTWLPNAYSGATPAASSMLSSLVSKAYIFLLIKFLVRAVGLEAFKMTGVNDVVFIYSVVAIVMGSVDAVKEHNVRRMVSYSSVAQIGYIFMAISYGSKEGMAAAVFHIIAHSLAKAMLFPAVDRLTEVSGGNENYRDLRGSGFRAPIAGLAFVIGAFSITGIPFLGGFVSKIYIATAAHDYGGWVMLISLGALAVSTVLNVLYFLRTVLTIYRPGERYPLTRDPSMRPYLTAALFMFACLNIALGVWGMPIMHLIESSVMAW